MIVILTEDTKAGYAFYQELAQLFKGYGVTVYNSGCSEDTQSGGATVMADALRFLLNKGKIGGTDTVYLALDKSAVVDGDFGITERQWDIYNDCKSVLEEYKGVTLMHSQYVCFEEVVLTFSDLLHFCIPVKALLPLNYPDKMRYIKIYAKNHRLFTQQYINENYLGSLCRIFASELHNGGTLEQCLSDMLYAITTTENYSAFKVSKAIFGNCWTQDCSSAKTRMHNDTEREMCRYCYPVKYRVCKTPEKGKNRFIYFIEHSRVKEILKELNLYTIFTAIQHKEGIQKECGRHIST